MFPSKEDKTLLLAIGSKVTASEESTTPARSEKKRKGSTSKKFEDKQLEDSEFIDFFQKSPIALHWLSCNSSSMRYCR